MEHLLSHQGIMILLALGCGIGAIMTLFFWSLEKGNGSMSSMLEMHL